MLADSQKAQAAQLALEELIATRASLKALLLQQLNEEEELPIALPQGKMQGWAWLLGNSLCARG